MEAKLLPQLIATFALGVGAYAYGTALGWTSNITNDLKQGSLNNLKMKNKQLSWTGSCFTLGAMVSCLCYGFLADVIGRKNTCLLTLIPFTFGWCLILFAIEFNMVYAGRFLTGVAGGVFNVIAPLYITEISQIHIRGSLAMMMQLCAGLGVLQSNVLGWALPLLYFNIVCAFIPILFGILFWFQPETPFYYLKKGKTEDVTKSFKRLRGQEYDFSVELKYFNLELAKLPSNQTFKTFFQILNTKSQLKATFICFMLMFFQQFSGINAIVFYTLDIFINSRTPIPPHLAVIIIGTVGFLGNALSVWLIERLGRTLLLNTSTFFCAVSLFLLGLYFTMKTKLDEEDIRQVAFFLPILALLLFLFAFNMGLGPIPWLACSELLAAPIKAKLSSIAGSFHWLLAFLITRFYLNISDKIGIDNMFYIFMGICISCYFFVMLIIPETKNKTYVDLMPDLEIFFNS